MAESIKGYNEAVRYAKNFTEMERIAKRRTGQDFENLTPAEQASFKQIYGIPKDPSPDSKPYLQHTRFDKKAYGGYVKKYAKGGGVRKVKMY
tara:strand:- start:433 stop:708 length:276 start_codon:yes stop_codon:yes gene_type:complete